ncbi:MAG: anhydro-N-acetylmuramic acid kinase [Planctomycetota bacterium]|jgi:anhydro-N-acetylmuramic acid kinase
MAPIKATATPPPWVAKIPDTKKRCVLGIMAGTSADAVDLACVQIEKGGQNIKVRFLWHYQKSFPQALRRRLLDAMAPAQVKTRELAELHAQLGDQFAKTAKWAIKKARPQYRPSLIGLAGQTVCHLPSTQPGKTVTLQLGEPARVAAQTGIITVAEFRQSDVAVGGQGAPLVPWSDYILFKHRYKQRAVQNIGGIANVTWIQPNCSLDQVIAFDTGPGNMIIDALVAKVTNGKQKMDKNGKWAKKGKILMPVLDKWMKHPFLKRKPPKSTGRETFGAQFVRRQLKPLKDASKSPHDWIATATAFTARSIAEAYKKYLPGFHKTYNTEVILCGGGAKNPTLVAMLAEQLPSIPLHSSQQSGIPTQAKEAVSFAMLADACIQGTPANLTQATGAKRPVVLGRVIAP